MSKTIKVISIILIIALTVLMIMPPVTVKADTKNEIERFVSITGTEQYYSSGAIPVLIYYIIYILGSMGYGVFTIGQINDQMANPSFKALIMEIINEAEGFETGLASMEQTLRSNDGIFNVQADNWANMRETLQSIVDDETFMYAPTDFYLNYQPKFVNILDDKVRAITVNSTSSSYIRTQYNIPADGIYDTAPDISFLKSNSISSINSFVPVSESQYLTIGFHGNSAYSWTTWIIKNYVGGSSNITGFEYANGYQVQSVGVVPILYKIFNDESIDALGRKWKLSYYYYDLRSNASGSWRLYSKLYNTNEFISPDVIEFGAIPNVSQRLKVNITNDIDLVRSTDTVSINTDLAILDQIKQISQALEDIQISMPAVDDIPITSTNTIIKEVITNTETIVIPDNPALELEYPEIADLSLPALVMTKFPLSIPFDLFNAFSMFSQSAVKPEFDIPIVLQNAGINTSININFDHIDGIIEVFRWFILVSFVISLILLTRKIIKG